MKILLYCKNTEEDGNALQVAVEQAKVFNASVLLLSCISERGGVPEEVLEKSAAKKEQEMQEFKENIFTPAGIDCSSEVIVTAASPGEEVVRYADNHSVDTLIMSIHKRSKIGKMVFGSNSQFIILEAPCKVITIKC